MKAVKICSAISVHYKGLWFVIVFLLLLIWKSVMHRITLNIQWLNDAVKEHEYKCQANICEIIIDKRKVHAA